MIRDRTAAVDYHRIFYREAGDPQHPTLLLLHGFPSSSHIFRNLIPLLSDRFHIVAPATGLCCRSSLPVCACLAQPLSVPTRRHSSELK
jgi:pimeloyl-ACP methyl ester carboxylesterase